MLERFNNFIQGENLFQKGTPILLAVSGGIDSVTMCRLYSCAGHSFGIAHCNFGLRGKDADIDEKFVKELADSYQVKCWQKQFDTEKYARTNNISIQMAARELRYEWFEKIRKKNGFHFIATAHHQNDIIETVLINLTKGTGIAGIHGILPKQGKIIRPLLFATRQEIEQFAKQEKLRFREDISNASDKYLRNKIRNKVIPVLKEVNPDLEKTFVQNVQRFRDVELIYKRSIQQYRKKILDYKGEEIFIPINKLLLQAAPRSILFELLKEYNFNADQVEQIFDALDKEAGKQFLSATHRLIKDRVYCIISRKGSDDITNLYIEEKDKRIKIATKNYTSLYLKIKTEAGKTFKISKSNKVACLDYEKLEFPLQLRHWKQGDYFFPFGMKRKKKKLKKFFIDSKISIPDKEKIWILLSNKKIVWIVGYRIDERFKVTDKTKKIIIIEKKDKI